MFSGDKSDVGTAIGIPISIGSQIRNDQYNSKPTRNFAKNLLGDTSEVIRAKKMFEFCDTSSLKKTSKRKRSTSPAQDKPVEPSTHSSSLSQLTTTVEPQFEWIDGHMVEKNQKQQPIPSDQLIQHLGDTIGTSDSVRRVKYSSYARRQRSKRASSDNDDDDQLGWSIRKWGMHETHWFYSCLYEYGLDFSLLSHYMPNRDRREIILKYKQEDKINHNLLTKVIDGCYKTKVPVSHVIVDDDDDDLLQDDEQEDEDNNNSKMINV